MHSYVDANFVQVSVFFIVGPPGCFDSEVTYYPVEERVTIYANQGFSIIADLVLNHFGQCTILKKIEIVIFLRG